MDWFLYSELRMTSMHFDMIMPKLQPSVSSGWVPAVSGSLYVTKNILLKKHLCIDLWKSLVPFATSYFLPSAVLGDKMWAPDLINAVTLYHESHDPADELSHCSHWRILKEYTHLTLRPFLKICMGSVFHVNLVSIICPLQRHLQAAPGHREADHFQGMVLWLLNQHNPTKEQMLLLQRIFFFFN